MHQCGSKFNMLQVFTCRETFQEKGNTGFDPLPVFQSSTTLGPASSELGAAGQAGALCWEALCELGLLVMLFCALFSRSGDK